MRLYFVGLGAVSLYWDLIKFFPHVLVSYYWLSQNREKTRIEKDMKLYFASVEDHWRTLIASEAERVLFAYGKPQKDKILKLLYKAGKSLFIDSGAFSASTRGVKIDIDEYCDWLLEFEPHIEVYANLDVIGDPEATMRNQRYMERRGLHPLPVFHYGSDFGLLKELAAEYSYIALGGMVPLSRQKKKLRHFLARCFSITTDQVKVHGFGLTATWALETFPFYSVDSASWLVGSTRGEIYRFTGSKMISYGVKEKHRVLGEGGYGVRFIDTANEKKWRQRDINNIVEWLKYANWLTELWAKRGVRWDD